jgi:hypothetical protein
LATAISTTWAQPAAKPPSKEKPLVLQFPNDGSYGVIIKLPKDWKLDVKKMQGSKFADAKGTIELPLHEQFMFVPDYKFIEHPEVLKGVPGNAFVTLLLERLEAEDQVMPYICKLTGLKRIDLVDTELTDKGLENLPTLPNLQYLQLHEGNFTGSFLAHITPLKKLLFLRISACKAETKYLDQYSSVLPAVKSIHLAGDILENQDLLFARKYPHLEELHLDRNKHITDQGLIYLLPLKSLEFLNVDNTSVTANGIKQLAPVKIKRITVPKSFSRSEAALLQKEMKDTVIQMSSPGPQEVYKLFAPLH